MNSILRHSNDQVCGLLHRSNKDKRFYWTEWSDTSIEEKKIPFCANPIGIDIRQKGNKFKWNVSGNILLHKRNNQWIYGLPDNGDQGLQIFCFDQLQIEAFPIDTVFCTQMEKRYCCSPEKLTRRSKIKTFTSSEIIPPKLSEIIWKEQTTPTISSTTTYWTTDWTTYWTTDWTTYRTTYWTTTTLYKTTTTTTTTMTTTTTTTHTFTTTFTTTSTYTTTTTTTTTSTYTTTTTEATTTTYTTTTTTTTTTKTYKTTTTTTATTTTHRFTTSTTTMATTTTSTHRFTTTTTRKATTTTTNTTTTSTTTTISCSDIKTNWFSLDIPLGDGGTGDHELTTNINPCGEKMKIMSIAVRERNNHLPYNVRNVVFHKKHKKFYFGPEPQYGIRFVGNKVWNKIKTFSVAGIRSIGGY